MAWKRSTPSLQCVHGGKCMHTGSPPLMRWSQRFPSRQLGRCLLGQVQAPRPESHPFPAQQYSGHGIRLFLACREAMPAALPREVEQG